MATRRQILTAALAAPVLAAPVAANASPMLICTSTGTSPEWNAAVARKIAAETALNAYDAQVYGPVVADRAARKREIQALIDAVPHYTTTATFETHGKGNMSLTTSRPMDVRLARDFAARPKTFEGEGQAVDDWRTALSELHSALEHREAIIARIERDNPISPFPQAIQDELDRLNAEYSAALDALDNFPAMSLADLRAKIQYQKREGGDLDHDALLSDLNRIFGEA